MNKELKYNGYTTVPSDYECPDGDLAVSLNLISEENQLKPLFPPAPILELPDGKIIVYIHETATFTHYIIHDTTTNSMQWMDETVITDAPRKPVSASDVAAELEKDYPSHDLHSFRSSQIYGVNGVGNTLVVLTSEGMHYFLWKNTTEGYVYLGTHIPELPMSFGLQGKMVRGEEFTISLNDISSRNIFSRLSDADQTAITNQVLAKVNKFIADYSTDAGKFIFPFLVRYAYRLYDGTLTMHSAPILMVCSSDITPVVFWTKLKANNSIYYEADLRIAAMQHTLDYAVIDQDRIDMLKDWSDIVKSVDIFISKPIYTYDQNGKCEKFVEGRRSIGGGLDTYCICKHTNQDSSLNTTYPLRYQYNEFHKLYAFTFDVRSTGLTYPTGTLELPSRSTSEVKADIRSCSQFYILKSIKIDELTADIRTAVDVEKEYLQSLVTREVMTDDYDSHDTLIPRYAFAYNSRLNIANLKKKLYDTYNVGALFCYTDGYVDRYENLNPDANDGTTSWGVYFYIKQDGKDIIVKGESFQLSQEARFLFFFYPNVNAYKAVFFQWANRGYCYEVPLEAHGFLNGSFYFDGWKNSKKIVDVPLPSSDERLTVELPNKIYTSEVNNPFHFPVLGINTVGTGTILGISAAAKAMSQGQFGQFPLYAFTTEGVWALEVSSTGTYSAKQPITRDVCINPESITQLDDSVLFATDRGIMLISGSQTQCITDNIFSQAPFDVLTLPGINQLHAMLGHTQDACLPVRPFISFLAGCKMIYDYVHQRIFVYNPTTENGTPIYTYAYVWSLKSRMWGMAYTNLTSPVNAYPEALAMTNDSTLVTFSDTDDDTCKSLFITRPLKLDAANIHKTIGTLIQRGHFQRGDVGTVLYGSRDLHNWHLVWSSKDHYLRGFSGTPYKYFRIAGIASLREGQSIFGASVSFEPRLTNQLR